MKLILDFQEMVLLIKYIQTPLKGPSLYSLESDILLNRKIKKFSFQNKNFCGLYFIKYLIKINF